VVSVLAPGSIPVPSLEPAPGSIPVPSLDPADEPQGADWPLAIGIAPDGPSDEQPGVDVQEPEPTGPPRIGVLSVGLAVIMTLSVVVVFFGLFAFGLSGLQEQRSQHLLYDNFRGLLDPASPVAPPLGSRIPAGTAVALLSSPAAGLDKVVVVEGTTSGDLLGGPGHLPNTPLPGQAGDAIVMGKSLTAGAPFAHVSALRSGARLTVRTGQGRFTFVVVDRRSAGEPAPKVRVGTGYLTLVTAAGSGWQGRLEPTRLVYVDAVLKGKAVAAPRGRPKFITEAEVPGHGDLAALPWAAGALAALVAAVVACWYLWGRWGLLRTWLVGAPVLLAVLWMFSNELMRLVPNVY
jgi:sortase A